MTKTSDMSKELGGKDQESLRGKEITKQNTDVTVATPLFNPLPEVVHIHTPLIIISHRFSSAPIRGKSYIIMC